MFHETSENFSPTEYWVKQFEWRWTVSAFPDSRAQSQPAIYGPATFLRFWMRKGPSRRAAGEGSGARDRNGAIRERCLSGGL